LKKLHEQKNVQRKILKFQGLAEKIFYWNLFLKVESGLSVQRSQSLRIVKSSRL